MQKHIYAACCLWAALAPGKPLAEVTDAAPNGFSIRHTVHIDSDRETTYRAFVHDIGDWWLPDYTVSGNGQAMYLDARVNGCLCEALGDGAGVVHLAVTFVSPNVMLRLSGGLGPLGLVGASGNLTLEFADAEEGTTVTLNYVVGGYAPDGLERFAADVDLALADQLARFQQHTGRPR